MWKWVLGGVLILIVGGGVYSAVVSKRPVDVNAVRKGEISAFLEERARTRLPRVYRVTMPIDGRILPIDVIEGQAVEEGQVIAQLDPADLETAVLRARARVYRLQASVVESNDTRLEESVGEGTQHELVAIERAVEAARAKTDASAAQEAFHKTELNRIREAHATGAASQMELDRAILDELESRIDHRTDILVLRALEAIQEAARIGPRLVQQYIDKKALREAVLGQELAEAAADLEMAERDLGRADILAPATGVVLHRHVENERVLRAGEPLVDVGRLEDLEVEVEVLSQEAVDIGVGDRVDIFGPAIGHESIEGRVVRIEPQGFTKISSLGVEQQRVRVIVSFGPDVRPESRPLGVDFRVLVRIHTATADDAVIMPRSALFRGVGDRWQAFALRNGRARRVDLEIGLMNDREVQVLSGVSEGEEVILAPETSLVEGMRVEVRGQ